MLRLCEGEKSWRPIVDQETGFFFFFFEMDFWLEFVFGLKKGNRVYASLGPQSIFI